MNTSLLSFHSPIRIHRWFLWLIPGMMVWVTVFGEGPLLPLYSGMFVFLLQVHLGAVLPHELGHWVVGRWFGLRGTMTIAPLMGWWTPEDRQAFFGLSRWRKACLIGAGPLVNAVLALFFWWLEDRVPIRWEIHVFILYLYNWIMAWINLLPILPLDGGRLLQLLLEGVRVPRRVRVVMLGSAGMAGAGWLVWGNLTARQWPGVFFSLLLGVVCWILLPYNSDQDPVVE